MKYSKALDLANNFMESSGIRKYCREVCKGRCCESLMCDKENCDKKLSCSTYLCEDLARFFINHISILFYMRKLFNLAYLYNDTISCYAARKTGKCFIGWRVPIEHIAFDLDVMDFPVTADSNALVIKEVIKELTDKKVKIVW